MAIKKGAVIIDTQLNHQKITQEFRNIEAATQRLINKYNKSVDSIKSQELAISKVKDEIANLQLYKQTDLIKESEAKRLNDLIQKLPLLESKLSQTKSEAQQTARAIEEAFNEKKPIKELGGDFESLGKKVEQVASRIAKTILAIAVFDVAREGLRKLRDGFVSCLKTNDSFNSSLNQIKVNLMVAFAPIYNAILPALNSLMNVLSKVTGTIAVFVASLFGMNLKDATNQAKNLSKALNSTAKSGDKAEGSLAKFDNLEVISETSTSSASSSGTSSSGIDYSGEIVYSEKLLSILNKIKDALAPIFKFIKDFQEKHGTLATAIMVVAGALAGLLILKTIKKLLSGTKSVLSGVSANFTGFFDNLGKAANSIAILGGLALLINSITGLITAFSESGLEVSEVAAVLGTVLGEVALAFIALQLATSAMDWSAIAGAAVILGGLAIVLMSVTDLITKLTDTQANLSDVGAVLSAVFIGLIALMSSMTVIAKALASDPLMLVGILALATSITSTLLVMSATLPTILDACGEFIEQIAPHLIELLDSIFDGIQVIILAIGTTLPEIIRSVGDVFTSIFEGISKVINSVGNTMNKILKSVESLITTVLSSLLKFINQLGPAVNNFVDNAIKAVTKLINFIVSGIEYLVNTLIVSGVNKIIKSINSISEYVGIEIPTVSKMSIPRFVPKLATGAVIPPRQEFMAILGDQKHGTNIEAPLETIKQANREVLEEFMNKFSQMSSDKNLTLNNVSFVLKVGTGQLGKVVVDAIHLRENDVGKEYLLN